MYKDYRYINAGTNEIYRFGKKARMYVENCLTPNEQGYYSIVADGDKYWTIGTSEGQYGEYAKFNGEFLSVNKAGYVWAKEGTTKAKVFVEMLQNMLNKMHEMDNARFANNDEE